jgi:hypothetical protein
MDRSRLIAAVFLAVLPAGCGQPAGRFPSLLPRSGETPRTIPPAAVASGIDPAERARLDQELRRQEAALADADAELAGARRALARARTAARGTEEGSGAWIEVQMVLSRFDQTLARLSDIEIALADLGPLVDGLGPDDPDRARLADLERRVSQTRIDNERVAAPARS